MLKAVMVCTLMLSPCSSVAQAAPPASIARNADERAVLAADARQRDAVATADLKALVAISHRNLRINAARVLMRDDLIRMVRSGTIRHERFERFPESVVVTGNVGVVMGREMVVPGASSELVRGYDRKPIHRRYTNVFIREGGIWRYLARHSSVVGEVPD